VGLSNRQRDHPGRFSASISANSSPAVFSESLLGRGVIADSSAAFGFGMTRTIDHLLCSFPYQDEPLKFCLVCAFRHCLSDCAPSILLALNTHRDSVCAGARHATLQTALPGDSCSSDFRGGSPPGFWVLPSWRHPCWHSYSPLGDGRKA